MIQSNKQTASTPHRIANERGDHYTNHEGYVAWLRYCAGLWRERKHGASEYSRIMALAEKMKARPNRCVVCNAARRAA